MCNPRFSRLLKNISAISKTCSLTGKENSIHNGLLIKHLGMENRAIKHNQCFISEKKSKMYTVNDKHVLFLI